MDRNKLYGNHQEEEESSEIDSSYGMMARDAEKE
jgi:hypothetical protein